MKTNTKTLAVSLSLLASANALAGMGGLNVQSNLGEPFSGSIVVTGKEAEALLQSRSVNVSGGGISGSVVPQGNGNAVIRLHSGNAVNEPVLNFVVKAGNQTRQYTAMINPARYVPKGDAARAKVAAVGQPTYNAMDNDTLDRVQNDADRADRPVRKARSQSQRVTPMARSSNAQYHRVQTGETLAQIAARYRPHNMSQQRAMRAIMAANPRAFRRGTNGNIMYDGSTLYIPTGSQFTNYANSNKKRHTQRRLNGRRYVAPAVVPATTGTEAQVASQSAAPVVTPVAPQTSPPVAQVPSVPTVADEPVKKEEVTPTSASIVVTSKPASEVMASSAPVVASAAVAPVVASQTVAASDASMPAVSASAASVAVASVPAKPTVKPQQPKPIPQPEPEPETDWLPLALGGVAGLALLGGAGYFLSRRRKAAEEGDDLADDEFVVVDDEFVVEETATVSPAVAAAQRINLGKQADEPVFNDRDDNVFFDDKTAAAPKPVADEFDLNNFEPDNTFEVQSVDIQESEAEWDWLNDDNIDIDATAQDNNGVSSKPNTLVATAAAVGATVAENQRDTPEFDASKFDVKPESAATEASSDDDWLNEIFAADEAATVVEETVVESEDLVFEDFNTVSEPTPMVKADPIVAESSDFDLDFDVVAPAAATVVTETSQEDDLSFDLSDGLSLPENEMVETSVVDTMDDLSFDLPAESEADVSFELNEIETPTPDSFDLPNEEPVDFNVDLPAEETTADFNLDLPSDDFALDTNADLADLDLNVAEPVSDSFETDLSIATEDDGLSFTAEEPSLPADNLAFSDEEVNTAELDSLNSLSDLDLSFDDHSATTIEAAPTLDDDTLSLDDASVTVPDPVVEDLSWMNEAPFEAAAPHNEANAAGFVSEAVGMAAPQEAKLELAKMYLEIDDAVAARETLRELIGESHGELQQQAKDLLAELGG